MISHPGSGGSFYLSNADDCGDHERKNNRGRLVRLDRPKHAQADDLNEGEQVHFYHRNMAQVNVVYAWAF